MSQVKYKVDSILGYSTVMANIGELQNENDSDEPVIVMIPGNPGLIEFYEVFFEELYKLQKIPIIGLSHAGHSPTYKFTNKSQDTPPLGLNEQIDHKIECVKKLIPKDKKMIFVGHSIGAYIVLKLMDTFKDRCLHGILLFPTIENMIKTSEGQFWSHMIQFYFRYPLLYIAFLFSYMPIWLQDVLVRWRAKGRMIDKRIQDVCRSCVDYNVLNQGFSMVDSELKLVTDIDQNLSATIHNNAEKLTVYYGSGDRWTPTTFVRSFKDRFPEIDARFGDDGFKHDFVLDSSEGVAALCSNILVEKLF